MDIFIQIILNSVIAGAIYALVSLGFNLIYSTARFFDLAYGGVIAVGGYAVYYFYRILGLNVLTSITLGILVAGLVGFLIERMVYKQLRARKASNTVLLVASLGILTAIQAVISILFSSRFLSLTNGLSSNNTFNVFGGAITEIQVAILAVTLLVMIIMAVVLKYTLFGKAIRAVADDSEVASIVGINSNKIMGLVFFIGSLVAGVAGIAVGFESGIRPMMSMALLLKGFIVVVIGGVGSIYGGVLAAFFLAVIENIGVWQFSSEWRDTIAFLVLIVFLLFRPRGFFSKK
ncbi:MAG: branched-chain amino acid ABC transporter permease [bacterium]